MAVEPPKMEEAKCTERRKEIDDPTKPPRKRKWRHLVTFAAIEKQANAALVPTSAVTRMLLKLQGDIRER